MDFEELFDFVAWEHDRLTTKYDLKGNPKTRYTIFTKLVEEMGELSEAVLASDSLQRSEKLADKKTSVSDEVADVILTSLILAEELKVDVRSALMKKMEKIRARKY